MSSVKAHVRNGYIVSDEPADLPEGTAVDLHVIRDDAWSTLSGEERAAVEQEIEEGYEDVAAGNVVEAHSLLAELRAKNS